MLTETASKKIKLLPEHLIDQIKAGEVIERPASLLKELLENSIDANSKNIHIQIRENGLELISIEDDGDGMGFADLPYAFCRHATSKIERFEDLYALHSYGFRGEALASIASSSRVTCTSQPLEGAGGKIIFHGSQEISHDSFTALKSGTSFFIKDLFYNTPARFKFIKSKISEKNALKRMLFSFIITHPFINFSVKWDDKEKEFFPQLKENEDIRKRFNQLLSKKWKVDDFHLFEAEYDGHQLIGFFSKEGSKGNSGKQQFLFANDRIFNDLSLHRSVMRGLEKFWGPRLSGHYVFLFKVPPSQIDVNVHPNKTHVKFFKSNIIYSLISGATEKLFKDCNFTQKEIEQIEPAVSRYIPSPEMSPQLSEASALKRYFSISFYPFENIFMAKRSSDPKHLLAIKKNEILEYFLILHYENFRNDDQDITPLLICEPFEAQLNKEQMSFLLDLGIEFDQINEDKLMLRTIPIFFGQLPIRQLVGAFLEGTLSLDELSFDHLLQKLHTADQWDLIDLNTNHYEEILESINFNINLQYPFLLKLAEDNF